MYNLGMVMAKSKSTRRPDKNIADICGKPMFSYSIESLKASGVVSTVIVSTDSEKYADIAMKHGADDVILREPGWDEYPFFQVCADYSLHEYQERTGRSFESVILTGANIMFLRPSWVRTAYKIMKGYLQEDMPIDVVAIEHPPQANVLVCRIRHGIMRLSEWYLLKHVGLLMEIDWEHEIELARQLVTAIRGGELHYPICETIHDSILERMEESSNRMGGLTRRSEVGNEKILGSG